MLSPGEIIDRVLKEEVNVALGGDKVSPVVEKRVFEIVKKLYTDFESNCLEFKACRLNIGNLRGYLIRYFGVTLTVVEDRGDRIDVAKTFGSFMKECAEQYSMIAMRAGKNSFVVGISNSASVSDGKRKNGFLRCLRLKAGRTGQMITGEELFIKVTPLSSDPMCVYHDVVFG